MLIALMTILFLGGSSFGPMLYIDEARDNAKSAIMDDDQRKLVRDDLKSMKKRAKQYAKSVKGLTKDLRKEFGDHAVGEADLDVYWDQVFALNVSFSDDIIDMRFELRDKVSREEWSALFPADSNDTQ